MVVGSRTLEAQLDLLLAALHAQVGRAGDGDGGSCGGAGWAPGLGPHCSTAAMTGAGRGAACRQVLVQVPAEAGREQEWGGLSSLVVL